MIQSRAFALLTRMYSNRIRVMSRFLPDPFEMQQKISKKTLITPGIASVLVSWLQATIGITKQICLKHPEYGEVIQLC